MTNPVGEPQTPECAPCLHEIIMRASSGLDTHFRQIRRTPRCVNVNGILYPLVSTVDSDVYSKTSAIELESGVDRDPFEVQVGRGDLSGY